MSPAAREAAPPAFLVVLPDAGGRDVRPDLPLVGLPLLRRIALAATRAGFAHVLVARRDAATDAVLAGTGAVTLATGPSAWAGAVGRVVLLSERVIPQVDWLRRLRTMPLPPEHAHRDSTVAAALDAGDAGQVIGQAARLGRIDAALAALPAHLEVAEGGNDVAGRFVLDGPGDVDRAEQWMLRGLIKDSEGFMSRHVERRLSLFATRRLARTAVTPNTVTLIGLAIGLAAAPCFLSPRPGWQVTGALAFLLHSILDGCDGELARLKFLESRLGAVLDFWGDNLVHVAVFGAMALGWARAAGSRWPLVAGMLAVLGTLAAAGVLHRRQVAPGREGPGKRAAGRLVDRLAHRDFIYLILALAWWGRGWWFVVLAACGIPLFLLAVIAIEAGGRAGPRA